MSVVVTDHEYDLLNQILLAIEQRSKKRHIKWHKARFTYRLAYLEAVIAEPLFADTIFFSHYQQTLAYFDLTVETTAEAIRQKAEADSVTTVTVDGLSGSDVDRFKRRLRELQINVRKVRGARDESEPLIRLADAIAGFIRDGIEGQEYAQGLYQRALAEEVFRQLQRKSPQKIASLRRIGAAYISRS